jgi:hypothetical protein
VVAPGDADIFDEAPQIPIFYGDAGEHSIGRLACVVTALINEKKMCQALILTLHRIPHQCLVYVSQKRHAGHELHHQTSAGTRMRGQAADPLDRWKGTGALSEGRIWDVRGGGSARAPGLWARPPEEGQQESLPEASLRVRLGAGGPRPEFPAPPHQRQTSNSGGLRSPGNGGNGSLQACFASFFNEAAGSCCWCCRVGRSPQFPCAGHVWRTTTAAGRDPNSAAEHQRCRPRLEA